jgi:hypothetical protein
LKKKEVLVERKIPVNTPRNIQNFHHQPPDKNPDFIEEGSLFLIAPPFNLHK